MLMMRLVTCSNVMVPKTTLLHKYFQLVFYCMAGVRSKSAALQFEQAGYSDVSNYLGGWWEWNSDWDKDSWMQWSQKTGFPLNPKLLEQL